MRESWRSFLALNPALRYDSVNLRLLVSLAASFVVMSTTSYAYPNKGWTALKSCPSFEAARKCTSCKDTGTEVQFIVNVREQRVETQSRIGHRGLPRSSQGVCMILDPATWSCESLTSKGSRSRSHMMFGVYTEVIFGSVAGYFCAEGSKLIY